MKKKLLGWQLGIVWALVWGIVMLGYVVVMARVTKPDVWTGGLLIPSTQTSPTGFTVGWLSGFVGFSLVSAFFITRRTVDTATKGYLFSDLLGSFGLTYAVFTAFVVGGALIYPQTGLSWPTQHWFGIVIVVAVWLAMMALGLLFGLYMLSIIASYRRIRSGSYLLIIPIALLGLQRLVYLNNWAIQFPGGTYRIYALHPTLFLPWWLILIAIVLLFAGVIWLTKYAATRFERAQ
ncbi:hypothetical protein [Lacticaseibacillus saniviri]